MMRSCPVFGVVVALAGCTNPYPDETGETGTPAETGETGDSDTIVETDVDTDTGGYDTAGYDTGGWYAGHYDLTFTGTGYGDYAGHLWWLAIYDADGTFVDSDDGEVGSDGTIDAARYYVLLQDQSYRVDLIVDGSGNRVCDAVPEDAAWTYDVPIVSGNVDLIDTGASAVIDDPSVCSDWSDWHWGVALSGSGYQEHAGQDVHYALVDFSLQEVWFTSDAVIGSDGAIDVTFPEAFAEWSPYLTLVWYVESNATAACQPPTATTPDPQWSVAVLNNVSDVTLVSDDSTTFTDVCWAFPP